MGVFKNHNRETMKDQSGRRGNESRRREEPEQEDNSRYTDDRQGFDNYARDRKNKNQIGNGLMAGAAASAAVAGATGMGTAAAPVVFGAAAVGAALVVTNSLVGDKKSGRARQTREYNEDGKLDKVNGYTVERQGGETGYYDEQGYWHQVR